MASRLDPLRFQELSMKVRNRLDICLTSMEIVAYSVGLPTYDEQTRLAKVLIKTGEAFITSVRAITAMTIVMHKLRCIQDIHVRNERIKDPKYVWTLDRVEKERSIHVPLQRTILRQMRKVLHIYYDLDISEFVIAMEYQLVTRLVLAKT